MGGKRRECLVGNLVLFAAGNSSVFTKESLPEKVFLAGDDTDCCVLASALRLMESGVRPVVLTRYCAPGERGESASCRAFLLEADRGRGAVK